MAQRPNISENLSENIRLLHKSWEAVSADGVITESESAFMEQEFAFTKHQSRTVVAMEAWADRLRHTAHVDKNLITDLRALSREEEAFAGRGRVLQFSGHHRRRHAVRGTEPDDAA